MLKAKKEENKYSQQVFVRPIRTAFQNVAERTK